MFPRISSGTNKPTKEQLDSVDALIDNMSLNAVRFVHSFKIDHVLWGDFDVIGVEPSCSISLGIEEQVF